MGVVVGGMEGKPGEARMKDDPVGNRGRGGRMKSAKHLRTLRGCLIVEPGGDEGGFAVAGWSGDQSYRALISALELLEESVFGHPLRSCTWWLKLGFQHGIDKLLAQALVSPRKAAHL